MADINFDCPHCGHNLEVSEKGAGLTVACPECSKSIEIPVTVPELSKSNIAFKCSLCGQLLKVSFDMAGQLIDCPACKRTIETPKAPTFTATSGSRSQECTRACPFCGETILAVAQKCKHCGEFLKPTTRQSYNSVSHDRQPPPVLVFSKSRGVYIILGLLFGGLGIHNFYASRYAVGATQVITTTISLGLLGLAEIDDSLGLLGLGLLFLVGIWVVSELFAVTEDGERKRMR